MNKSNVVEFSSRDAIVDPLSELLRAGAGQLIYQAVEAELNELLAEHSERRLADGKAGVVRNGYLPAPAARSISLRCQKSLRPWPNMSYLWDNCPKQVDMFRWRSPWTHHNRFPKAPA